MNSNTDPQKNQPGALKDEVFRDEINQISDFKFGTKVVKVFDGMVSRSKLQIVIPILEMYW